MREHAEGPTRDWPDKDSTSPTRNQNWERSDQPKAQLTKNLQLSVQFRPFEVNPWLVATLPVLILSDCC